MTTVVCRGILSDLDGTLIDSGDAVATAWTDFANEINRDPAEILQICHGKRTVEVIRLLGIDDPDNAVAVQVESRIINAGSKPIPGAVQFLSTLPPDCWCVVTSSLAPTAWSRFSTTHLPAPPVIVSAEDVPIGKPDPACYVLGANRLGVAPEDCVVFEDAIAGIASGKDAGATVIALETTEPRAELARADYVVRDFNAVQLSSATKVDGAWELVLEIATH